VHLIGFIIRIYHDAWSSECLIINVSWPYIMFLAVKYLVVPLKYSISWNVGLFQEVVWWWWWNDIATRPMQKDSYPSSSIRWCKPHIESWI